MSDAKNRFANEDDRETWMRCFAAAISGVFASRSPEPRPDPGNLVDWCGRIADAALEETRQREA